MKDVRQYTIQHIFDSAFLLINLCLHEEYYHSKLDNLITEIMYEIPKESELDIKLKWSWCPMTRPEDPVENYRQESLTIDKLKNILQDREYWGVAVRLDVTLYNFPE